MVFGHSGRDWNNVTIGVLSSCSCHPHALMDRNLGLWAETNSLLTSCFLSRYFIAATEIKPKYVWRPRCFYHLLLQQMTPYIRGKKKKSSFKMAYFLASLMGTNAMAFRSYHMEMLLLFTHKHTIGTIRDRAHDCVVHLLRDYKTDITIS